MKLTEAEHDVEKNDQNDSYSLYEETGLAHPERSRRYVLAACEEMRSNSTRIRSRCEDDERSHQIGKSSFRSKLMAPNATHSTAERIMAGIGQLSLRLTWAKNGENGTALSRARDHHIRDSYE